MIFLRFFTYFHPNCAQTVGTGDRRPVYTAPPFDGGAPIPLPRVDLPPAFFFPDPTESIPPIYDGGGRRGNNNKNTMALCRGPPPTIVPRGLPLTRSGGIPLSLMMISPP